MKLNSSADLNGNSKSDREHRLKINGVLPGTSYESFKEFHLKYPEYYARLLDYLRLVIDPESRRSVNVLELWDSFVVSLGEGRPRGLTKGSNNTKYRYYFALVSMTEPAYRHLFTLSTKLEIDPQTLVDECVYSSDGDGLEQSFEHWRIVREFMTSAHNMEPSGVKQVRGTWVRLKVVNGEPEIKEVGGMRELIAEELSEVVQFIEKASRENVGPKSE